MSRSRESCVYEGELFFGESKLKTWEPVCTGTVVVSLSGGTVLAFQGEEKVWECKMEPSLKCRVKDSFVQWQIKGPDGPLSYGMRLKTPESAQKFLDALTAALAEMQSKPISEPQTVLKVILPGKETTSISAPRSMTMSQLLKLITQRRHLDPLQYSLALPPDSPHGLGVLCQPQSTVGALKGAEIHVVRNSSQLADGALGGGGGGRVNHTTAAGPSSLRGGGEVKRAPRPTGEDGASNGASSGDKGSEQTIMLQVELPKGEKMAVKVNTNELLPDVLMCLCEMRDMNPDNYMFDLPSTMNGKTLQQLASNKVKIIPRVTGRDGPALGPKIGPPPPPPGGKKTQPPPSEQQQQQEPVGQRGRSGSLDSPLLSRKSGAAPPVPKGSRKVQPDLVKELSLKLQKGNVGMVGTEETDDGVEAPLTDDLEFEGVRSNQIDVKTHGHLVLPAAGNRIIASVSVDDLSDRASRIKKPDVDNLETSSGRTEATRGQLDNENTADSFSRQREGQSRYHPIKKKPVKIPEQDPKQQVQPLNVEQPCESLKQDVPSALLGGHSKKDANVGQIGDTSKQEAVAGERNDPTRQQANLGRAEARERGKQPAKTAPASVKRQQEREESPRLGMKVPEYVEQPGHVQEPLTHPVGGGKQVIPADLPVEGAGSASDKYSSLKRKPRAAAPPPPVVSDKVSSAPPMPTNTQPQSHQGAQAATVNQKRIASATSIEQPKPAKEQSTAVTQPDQEKPEGMVPTSSTATDKTAHKVPSRPAPARPAPARPAPAPPKQPNVSKPPAGSESSATASLTTTTASLTADGSRTDKVNARPVTATLATTAPSEAPPSRSPSSQRRGGTMVSTYSREDGGKVLIVRQSPVLGRALPGEVVFKFPPPPSREEESKRAAAGGPSRTKEGAFTSPTKSDTSEDMILSPTKTDTSVEITNLDDVMSSSADEGDGRLVCSEETGVGRGSPQEMQSNSGSGTAVEDVGPDNQMADLYSDSDILHPGESEGGNGPSVDEPLSLPPPSDFELMPPEPVFDWDAGNENDDESVDGDGGIILLSVKPSELVDDIPPPEVPFTLPVEDNAAELLLPPPPAHDTVVSPAIPSPPLTPPVVLAPPPSVFGTLPNGVLPPAPPPPPPIQTPSSLSTPAPASSGSQSNVYSTSVNHKSSGSPSLLGKAPISSTIVMTSAITHPSSTGSFTPPSPLPPSFARYPALSHAVADYPTPPPPSIPTPPPARAHDIATDVGQFYSPLDSPALVPPPIDSPMDSPGLYQTGSLTLLDPPSVPELWQPDHLSSIPPPPDSSPPNSPSLGDHSSPIPHPPPPPPLTFGPKTSVPLVKPKPPAALRMKHMGSTFSEGEDNTHGGNRTSQLNKHPLSVKSKAPPFTKWKSLGEEGGQAELLSKLQERKAKLKEPSATLPLASTPQTIAPSVGGGGGDSMQVQLQMLQQQMLQQQMMQLQQQFQQLQMANMGYGVPPMAGMNLGLYHQPAVGGPNPALLSMPMGAQPGGVPFPLGYMPHSSGVGPAAATPLGMPAFGMVGIHSQPTVAPSSTLLGTIPGYPVVTQGIAEKASLPRTASRDELARTEKLGKLEEQFDNLMSEVRETDPSLVLKKAPVPEEREKDSGSPYTGMAAALADALKQRRKHLTEKVASVPEHDAHEWESSP